MRHEALVMVLRVACSPCLAAVPVAACQPHDEAEPLGFRNAVRQRSVQPDDPDSGAWINNGLANPDVTGVDPGHALSSVAGLNPDGALLADEANHGLVRYLTECALPEDATITKVVDGEPIEFAGRVGLAPEWEDDACDQDCQEWVSACLLARTNVSGQTVLRATDPTQVELYGAFPALGLEQHLDVIAAGFVQMRLGLQELAHQLGRLTQPAGARLRVSQPPPAGLWRCVVGDASGRAGRAPAARCPRGT